MIEYDSTQTVMIPASACSPIVPPGTDASLARCQYKVLVYAATQQPQLGRRLLHHRRVAQQPHHYGVRHQL